MKEMLKTFLINNLFTSTLSILRVKLPNHRLMLLTSQIFSLITWHFPCPCLNSMTFPIYPG